MKWFRLYDEILDDPKVQMLPGEQFKFWVNLMALANRSTTRGVVELSCQHIAWMLHLDASLTAQYLADLKQAGLLDELPDSPGVSPHNWSARQYKSDDSTGRSSEWRSRSNVASNKEDADATLHATTQEQQRNVAPSVSVNSVSVSEVKSLTKKKSATARQCAIPDDWVPTDRMLTEAKEKYPGINILAASKAWIGSMKANTSKYRYTNWGQAWWNGMQRAYDNGWHMGNNGVAKEKVPPALTEW